MNIKVRVISIILTLIFALNFASNFGIAFANTQDVKRVEAQRNQIRAQINRLQKLERQEANKLTKNQQKLENNQAKLRNSQKKYTEKQQSIVKLQKDLNYYLTQYNIRQKSTAERIRFIYKTKHTLILDLLLTTSSITDFMDRIYYQNLIIQSDKKKMQSYRQEAQQIALLKQKLETEKRELSGIIKVIDRENSKIKSTISQNRRMIEKIQQDKRAYERSERELKRQSDSLANIISQTTKNSGVTVGSGFIMPVQGRISSPFGYRTHPIFKSRTFHSGIDIAAPHGTPIKAANAGKVIYSGWYGGYGKVVILDHGSCTGQPTTTLYAHMSRQKVTVGENVTRGQAIGLVGSTGYSTGPHLHFEVRINGKPNNPKNYI